MKRKRRITFLGLALLLLLGSAGCGSAYKSPEGVVKALVKSYVEGDEKKIMGCYGVKKDAGSDLLKEVAASVGYYQAHGAKSVKIRECAALSSEKELTYVYAVYSLVLENKQEYPCISTYMVEKDEKQRYHVLPSSEITQEIGKKAAQEYGEFMKTDSYKDYAKDYEKFIKGNPGYEQRIADKMKGSIGS